MGFNDYYEQGIGYSKNPPKTSYCQMEGAARKMYIEETLNVISTRMTKLETETTNNDNRLFNKIQHLQDRVDNLASREARIHASLLDLSTKVDKVKEAFEVAAKIQLEDLPYPPGELPGDVEGPQTAPDVCSSVKAASEEIENNVYSASTKAASQVAGTGVPQIPYHSLLEIGKIFLEGQKKYGLDNWLKGVGDSQYQKERYEHALIHLMKYKEGDTSEAHLAKVAWFCVTQLELERRENSPIKNVCSTYDT